MTQVDVIQPINWFQNYCLDLIPVSVLHYQEKKKNL